MQKDKKSDLNILITHGLVHASGDSLPDQNKKSQKQKTGYQSQPRENETALIQSESERPLFIGGADSFSSQTVQDFDLVLMGHLHASQTIGQSTNCIAYAGSIFRFSFSEINQEKGVLIWDTQNHECQMQRIPLIPPKNFHLIKGNLKDILRKPGKFIGTAAKDEYFYIQLTDKNYIFEAMKKIREIFPHAVHLERIGQFSSQDSNTSKRRICADNLNPENLYHDFLLHLFDREPTAEQKKLFRRASDYIPDKGNSL